MTALRLLLAPSIALVLAHGLATTATSATTAPSSTAIHAYDASIANTPAPRYAPPSSSRRAPANVLTTAPSPGAASRSLAAKGADDTVSVFHGSINDATAITRSGLDPARAPTFVSRDIRAARDAIGPNRVDVMRDPGIIESRIPRSEFDRLLAGSERPYSGFNTGLPGSSEVVLRTPEQIALFNRYRVGAP